MSASSTFLTLTSNTIQDDVNGSVTFPESNFLTLTSDGVQTSVGDVELTSPDALNLSYQGIRAASSAVQVYPATGMDGLAVTGNVNGYLPDGVIPDAPTNLVLSINSNFIDASWQAPSFDGGIPLTGYVIRVYQGSDTSLLMQTLQVSPSSLSKRISSLINFARYTIQVYAKNLVGESETAAEASDIPTPFKAITPDFSYAHLGVTNSMASNWNAAVDNLTMTWTVEFHTPLEVDSTFYVRFENDPDQPDGPLPSNTLLVDDVAYTTTVGFLIPSGESSFTFDMKPVAGTNTTQNILNINDSIPSNYDYFGYVLFVSTEDEQEDSYKFKVINQIVSAYGVAVRLTKFNTALTEPIVKQLRLTTASLGSGWTTSQGVSLAIVSSNQDTTTPITYAASDISYVNIRNGREQAVIDLFDIPAKVFTVTILLAINEFSEVMNTKNPLFDGPTASTRANIELLDADGNEVSKVTNSYYGLTTVVPFTLGGYEGLTGLYLGTGARQMSVLYPSPESS